MFLSLLGYRRNNKPEYTPHFKGRQVENCGKIVENCPGNSLGFQAQIKDLHQESSDLDQNFEPCYCLPTKVRRNGNHNKDKAIS
jgi:hypothetical protein